MHQSLDMPVFDGNLVSLRAIEPGDWPTFAEHERDYRASRTGGGWAPVPWSAERLRTWAAAPERSMVKDDHFTFGIGRPADSTVVGTINTHHCDRRAGVFSYGIVIWPAHRRVGLASEAVKLVVSWMFGELRYQKCDVTIYDFNEASIAFHRRLGFVEEGRRRRATYTAGAHHDELLFGITAEEFWAAGR